MHFAIVLRRAGVESDVVAWDHHFDPLASGTFDPQPLDLDADGVAVAFQHGDQIVFRYTGASAANVNAYIPDGEGVSNGGRNPAVILPK